MSPSSRPRGAPPGNTNAIKHGLYSAYFTSAEHLALDGLVAGNLADELELLRLTILASSISLLREPEENVPYQQHIITLRTVALAIARLQNLVHTRLAVFGDPDEREIEIARMLAAVQSWQRAQAASSTATACGSMVVMGCAGAGAEAGCVTVGAHACRPNGSDRTNAQIRCLRGKLVG